MLNKKMIKNKYLVFSILALGLISLTASIFIFLNKDKVLTAKRQTSNNVLLQQIKTYVNKKGEKWSLPIGNYKFKVTQAAVNQAPVFLEGEIDPPDVHVGDTQYLRVIVQSPVGIKKVTAYIETDSAIKELPLEKVGIVSYHDMEPNEYIVKNGILEILTPKQAKKQHQQKIAAEKQSIIKNVKAQDGNKEKWENFWVVHDTHETTYHTTFIVEDNAGLTNSLTLAWSDLCGIPINGDLYEGTWNLSNAGDCTISIGQLDGIERGNVTIDYTFNLLINGTFVFNPGYQINMTGGNILIGTSGQIKKTLMWYCDKDGDGRRPDGQIGTIFAQNNLPCPGCPSCPGGPKEEVFNNLYKKIANFFSTNKTEAALACGPTEAVGALRRYYFVPGQIDCYEESKSAHEGSGGFCLTHRGDGSWDYNCDNALTKEYAVSTIGCTYQENKCQASCSNKTLITGYSGFKSPLPNCGQQGEYISSCSNTGYEGCFPNDGTGLVCCDKTYTCINSVPIVTNVRIMGCF